MMNVTTLIQETINNIYALKLGSKPWFELETTMSALNARADKWLHSLPECCQFQGMVGKVLSRERFSLALLFFSTKLFICQPCIVQILRQPNKNTMPCEIENPLVTVCIKAATNMIHLLPDEPDLRWLYETCPWWYFLHYLMQALAVCLTALFIGRRLVADESLSMKSTVDKAMHWLGTISSVDASSQEAFRICTETVAKIR
jgi:hypothetical protein